MSARVAIVGVGLLPASPITPEYSYKELMWEAARRAYDDAGIDAREDVDSFVTCAEDFWEGTSIFDEYVPDQLGAVHRPTCTVSSDGMYGVATAYMQIATGRFNIVVVEAHSKSSEVLDKENVERFAMDPVYERPLINDPRLLAAMEMRAFLESTGNTPEHCSAVVEKNAANALRNPLAAYGDSITKEDVNASEPVFDPLRKLDISKPADSAAVLVLSDGETAGRLCEKPVWIRGIGWHTGDANLGSRDWREATYAESAARRAFKMGEIEDPTRSIDFAEVDDSFSYKELQHLEAAGLSVEGESGNMVDRGDTGLDGELPVNPSGGSIGMGNLSEANGLMKVAQAALQLRGEAGRNQIENAHMCMGLSWRGLPTASGAAVVLEGEM